MSAIEENTSTQPLDEESLRLRRLVLRALSAADKGHIGSALSLIEIFRVLYGDIVKHDPSRPAWEARDRVILSKGHGCLALYAVLADCGYFPADVLDSFCSRHSPLGGHPERRIDMGIEASTGALGHGLPFAVGIAVAHMRRQDGVKVFAVVGDGELGEGSNWEAMLIAAKYHLGNLTVVVDNNGEQIHGALEKVLPIEPLRAKFESFGAYVVEADGHNVDSLVQGFRRSCENANDRPSVLICHTVKGKGLAIAERNPLWHYKRSLGREVIDSMGAQWKS
jgi:transketolase